MSDHLPPAGWYPDPTGSGRRYWDGEAWTAATTGLADHAPVDARATGANRPVTPGSDDAWTDVSQPASNAGTPPGGQAGPWAARAVRHEPVPEGSYLDRVKRLPPLVWVGLAVVAVFGLYVSADDGEDIAGSFTLIDGRFASYDDGEPCTGTGGYGDIGAGRTVRVSDGAGELLATGALGPGRTGLVSCVFDFELLEVPSRDLYVFEVGRRGELTYSHDELRSAGWTVDFVIGD